MLGKSGRRLKYAELLTMLNEDTLYAAVSISEMALQTGYVKVNDPEKAKKLERIRNSCQHLSRKYGFPPEGDGFILITGQKRIPAWYGKRWRSLVAVEDQPNKPQKDTRGGPKKKEP